MDSGDAPDYTPVANASEATAQLGYDLGNKQLEEARRQYDLNMGVVGRVVDAQLGIMEEQIAQGKEAAEYAKTFRPMEQDMLEVAMNWRQYLEGAGAERDALRDQTTLNANILGHRRNSYDDAALADHAMVTGGTGKVMERYGADINADVDTAVADVRRGQSQAQNSAIRQAMRYGMSVPTALSSVGTQGASAIAAAANNARTGAVSNYRNLVAQGMSARNEGYRLSTAMTMDEMTKREGALKTARDQRIQDEAITWGRGMDVAGLGRGMAGMSQGAYSLATNAGSNAAQNQMASSNVLMQGLQTGAQTQLQGKQIGINGLATALGGSGGGGDGGLSGLIGGALGAWASTGFAWSDRRLKRDITRLCTTAAGRALYAFRYLWSDEVHVGIMADEVADVPGAVVSIGGFHAVDYRCLA